MSGLSSLTDGGGLSASGGAAGPATSGVISTSTVSLGGNGGIGSTTGFSTQTLLIIGGVALVAFFLMRKK